MNRKHSHTGKSKTQKTNYKRYIDKLDLEPTLDDTIQLNGSDQSGEELSEPTIRVKRKISTGDQIKNHLSLYWINWVIIGVGILLIYLFIESKIHFSGIDKDINNHNTSISTINQSIKDIENCNHRQDLDIQNNKLCIEFLKKNNK